MYNDIDVREMEDVRKAMGMVDESNKPTLEAIWGHREEMEACYDLYAFCKEVGDREYLIKLKDYLEEKIRNDEEIVESYRLLEKVLKESARFDFDSFLIYMEWGRENRARFYMPRRTQLRGIVSDLQDLADGKIRLLSISCPPGVGKTTLGLLFFLWCGARFPHLANLMFSHSAEIINGTYRELIRFMEDTEYRFKDIFPDVKISSTNAKNLRIDLNETKRFETFEFTSIGASNAGSFRAMNLLYCDDLVDGYETAMSIDRLNKLWGAYTVDARQRKQGNDVIELHIATRWSVHDVIGRLEQMYKGDEKARFVVVPALNENEESNFDYPYGLGFSTKTYLEQREIMDDVSWKCLYMNEPIEREGLLFEEEELRRYFYLPDKEPDGIFAVCDTKARGEDYCVMPIGYMYGEDCYIVDCVCDNGKPEIIDEKLVMKLGEYDVQLAQFESNVEGSRIAEKVQKELKKKGKRTKITTKYTTTNKETKILVNAPYIKQHFLFKDKTMYNGNKEYMSMVNMLCSYSLTGKNKHDDVPDALSMLSAYLYSNQKQVTAIKRPF